MEKCDNSLFQLPFDFDRQTLTLPNSIYDSSILSAFPTVHKVSSTGHEATHLDHRTVSFPRDGNSTRFVSFVLRWRCRA
jgi:hypothetical protein